MAEIEVEIAFPEHIHKGKSWRLLLPDNVQLKPLLLTIGKRLGITRLTAGNFPVTFALYDQARGRLLKDHETLAKAGVESGSALTLLRAAGQTFSAVGVESSTTALVEFFGRVKEGRCANDGVSLQEDPSVVLCKQCGAPHHASCWENAHGRCSRQGCGWAGDVGEGRRLADLVQSTWLAVFEQSSSLEFMKLAPWNSADQSALLDRFSTALNAALSENEGEDDVRLDGAGEGGASVTVVPRFSIGGFLRRNVLPVLALGQLVFCLLVPSTLSVSGIYVPRVAALVSGLAIGGIALWRRAWLVAVIGLLSLAYVFMLPAIFFALLILVLACLLGWQLRRELRPPISVSDPASNRAGVFRGKARCDQAQKSERATRQA